MEYRNTTKRGGDFENRVYSLFKELLRNEELGISSKNAQLFRKKRYFSERRKKYIEVDLSIEITISNSTNPFMAIIIECKDYSSPVSISEIEEFESKVRQISGLNCKAIFVTSNALQESAYNYAVSGGIAIIRLMPENQVEWITYNTSNGSSLGKNNSSIFKKGFLIQNYMARNKSFFGRCGRFLYGDVQALLRGMIKLYRQST